jgi:type IV pilus assembly protein PilB
VIPQATATQDRAVEYLRETEQISEVQVERAEAARVLDPLPRGLAYYLVESGAVTAESLRSALQRVTGLEVVQLDDFPPQPETATLLPARIARALRAVPISVTPTAVHVALAEPYDIDAHAQIQSIVERDVHTHLTDEHSLWKRIADLPHDPQDDPDAGLEDVEAVARAAALEVARQRTRTERGSELIERAVDRAKVPQLVDGILREGIQRHASDIHIEFFRTYGWVRFRIDGTLVEWDKKLDAALEEDLIGRIKIMANLDSTNRRTPQDGRLHLKVGNRDVEFRVSTLPTVRGEKAVLRILDHSQRAFGFENLGFAGANLRRLKRAASQKTGMILLTGPTGSGKTTTMHSVLSYLAKPEVNIITVEDPVERELPMVTQVNVRSTDSQSNDLSYATVLRAMLRQDPNVLMVGEIRDPETAQVAVRASMTGHLLLSTLHTNSAPATVHRLFDLGLEPYNIADALRLIIAQRLVRRICGHCREPYTPAAEQLNAVGAGPDVVETMTFHRGRGCMHCNHTGYRGRIGIYEMMEMNDETRSLIVRRASEAELALAAKENGMQPLRAAGWQRIREGVTTLDEVLKET